MPTSRHWSPIAALLVAICLLLGGAGCAKTELVLEGSATTSQQELNKARASVSWLPASLVVTLAPGETRQLSVTVKALENISATSVEVGAPLAAFVTVTPAKVPALKNGATASLTVKVVAPTSTRSQTIKGELSLRKGTDCKKNEPALCASLPLQVTIKESVAQTIQRLEGSGVIPVLDRGDDLDGPDANGNGIRDDIDTYIAKQSYDGPARLAVQQLARAIQAAVVLGGGQITTTAAQSFDESKMNKAVHCLAVRFAEDPTTGTSAIRTYNTLTANTPARMRAYARYNDALEGTTSISPEEDTCEK